MPGGAASGDEVAVDGQASGRRPTWEAPSLEPRDENDDRDEDGASHVGLLPEACPSTATSSPDAAPPGMGPL